VRGRTAAYFHDEERHGGSLSAGSLDLAVECDSDGCGVDGDSVTLALPGLLPGQTGSEEVSLALSGNPGWLWLGGSCPDDALADALDVAATDDLPWSHFYLSLGSVLTGLVVVAGLGLEPFSWLGGFGYALGVTVAFTAVAAYHTVRDRRRRVSSGTGTTTADHCPPPAELDEANGSNADRLGAGEH